VKKAYRVTACGECGIIAAETPGQARFRVFNVCRDVGLLGPMELSEIKVRRAPEHDDWAAVDSTGTCWTECYLPTPLKKKELL